MNKKLKDLVKEVFKGKRIEEQFIAIYEGKKTYPDYADEILETHGDYLVKDYRIRKDGILVVLLKEDK